MTDIDDVTAAVGLFVPHPGSRLDAAARAAAQAGPAPEVEVGTIAGTPRPVVPVAAQAPAQGRGYVVVLSAANPVLPVLPRDDARRRAVVLAVDNDVYLGSSKADVQLAAGGAAGTTAGYLPAGIGMPVDSKNDWYAGATTAATSSRVSVWIFLDEPS